MTENQELAELLGRSARVFSGLPGSFKASFDLVLLVESFLSGLVMESELSLSFM